MTSRIYREPRTPDPTPDIIPLQSLQRATAFLPHKLSPATMEAVCVLIVNGVGFFFMMPEAEGLDAFDKALDELKKSVAQRKAEIEKEKAELNDG
jgi:hypothetical protein